MFIESTVSLIITGLIYVYRYRLPGSHCASRTPGIIPKIPLIPPSGEFTTGFV